MQNLLLERKKNQAIKLRTPSSPLPFLRALIHRCSVSKSIWKFNSSEFEEKIFPELVFTSVAKKKKCEKNIDEYSIPSREEKILTEIAYAATRRGKKTIPEYISNFDSFFW